MIKSLINKLLMVLYFVIGALILEFITFKVLNFGVLPDYFMLDLSVILILGLLVFCIPNFTVQYIIYTILLLVQIVFIYINYTLFTIYGDLFSFDMIYLVGEAAAAVTTNFVYFKIICQLLAIFFGLAIVGAVLLTICRKDKIKIKQHFSIFNIILLLSIQFLSIGYYTHIRSYINVMGDLTDANYTESDAFLMNTNFLKSTSYKKFGSYGYMLNLIFNSLGSINEAHKKAAVNFFKSGNIYDDSAVFGVDSIGVGDKKEYNNVIVIMMESLEWFAFSNGNIKIEDEVGSHYDKNAVLENLSYELTPNIYSIIYGQDYLTDPSNENKNNDAMIAENFFAKSKTNISEGYGILGSYPVGEAVSSFAGNRYDKNLNAFGYTLPNMLKNAGYQTTYIHSNVASFYSRNETHGNLGFDKCVFKDNLLDENGNRIYTGSDLDWGNWAPEAEFARYAMDDIVPNTDGNKPFFSFYLNVSTHGSYMPEDNLHDGDVLRYYDYVKYGKNNCQLVKIKGNVNNIDKFYYDEQGNIITDIETLENLYPNASYFWEKSPDESLEENKYSEYYTNLLKNYGGFNQANDEYYETDLTNKLLYYQCGVMGLDEAIGAIIKTLKDKGIYDKTTMLMYSDHYCYYDSVSNDVKGIDSSDALNIELNTIPMILSSPGLKALSKNSQFDFSSNNRFCSAYDIIPTLLDLLGIPFNENFYLGHSIFAPAEYVYVIDEQTGLAREAATGETAVDLEIYYSNTGGMFCKDCFSIDLKTYFDAEGNVLNDPYLASLFKSEATNQLIKLNYLHILNRNYLYSEI